MNIEDYEFSSDTDTDDSLVLDSVEDDRVEMYADDRHFSLNKADAIQLAIHFKLTDDDIKGK